MTQFLIMFLIFWIWENLPIIYGHRSIVHKQFVFHPWIVDIINIIKWTQRFNYCPYWVRFWIAPHLKHHALADTKDDPHSPKYYSFFYILTSKAGTPVTKEEEEFYTKTYNFTPSRLSYILEKIDIGPIVMLITFLLIFSWSGIILWLICLSTWWIPGVFNYISHGPIGYRNFTPKGQDRSINLPPLSGLIFGGEEFHSNHHHRPNRVNFATRWWEVDLGYQLLKILSWVGLVTFSPKSR